MQEQQQEQEQEERTAKRRKKSSFEEYKSKRKSSESSKEGEVKEVDDCQKPLNQPVDPILPRKVSGILIIERGLVKRKRVSWRQEEDLVQVKFFEVDTNERVNVCKLKFEEVCRQEREKDRKIFKEEIERKVEYMEIFEMKSMKFPVCAALLATSFVTLKTLKKRISSIILLRGTYLESTIPTVRFSQ